MKCKNKDCNNDALYIFECCKCSRCHELYCDLPCGTSFSVRPLLRTGPGDTKRVKK